MRPTRRTSCKAGFTLVELVVVIMIIGLLAALAIPRFSRGSDSASDATLQADLRLVRYAIMLYAAEHNGAFPAWTAERVVAQLTQYTDRDGGVSSTRTGAYVFGPYLRAIPPCPNGVNAGSSSILIDKENSPPEPIPGSGDGWVYNPNTGQFIPNDTELAGAEAALITDGG